MNKLILIFILLLLPILSFAQTTGSVKGNVVDAGHDYGLQLATVTIFKKADSSLVNYQVTTEQGGFNISGLPLKTPLLVGISFTGYIDFSKELILDSLTKEYDFKKIKLARDSTRQLDAVVVKSVVPVRMNGDTLEMNPQAFKLDSSAVVEDMLLRVPGVTMWSDGTITVNGRKVNNVYVDGKPFFGNNPALATQNLPKNAIEKIQVYQEKDYSKQDITNTQADSLLTMNIKLGADKRKGFFGKAAAGIGSDKRYEGDLTLQGYNKNTRAGIAGDLNNINKTVDNVQAAMQNNTFRSFNRRNLGAPNAGASGLNTVHYFGATLQQRFDESTNTRFDNTISGDYNYRDSKADLTTDRATVQNINNYRLTTLSNQHNTSDALSQSVNGSYQNRKAATAFAVNTSYNWSNTNSAADGSTRAFKNDTLQTSRGSNTSLTASRSNNLNLNAYFNNNDYDEGINKKSFSTNYSINYNNTRSDSKNTSTFQSLADSIYTSKYNRKYHNESSSLSTNLGLNYNGLRSLLFGSYNFWNINIGLRDNFRYTKSDLNANVADLDTLTNTYKANNNLTNLNSVANIDNRAGISFFKTFIKQLTDRYNRSLVVRTDLQNQLLYQKNISTLNYRNVERTYHFFTPATSVQYNYNRYNKYNITADVGHNSSATAPTIDQLYPIRDSINRYNIVIGNPHLKSSFSNNFNFDLNYNSQRFSAKTSYNAGLALGYNLIKNSIGDSSIYDSSGGRTSYMINIANRRAFNSSFNGGVAFRMNKSTLQLNYNINYTTTNTPQFINRESSTTKTSNLANSLTVFYSLLEIFNISITQSVNTSNSTQFNTQNQPLQLKTKTAVTAAALNITVPKDFTLSSNINYISNIAANNKPVRAAIWNANTTYRFLRSKQAEVKFSVFDILRQNRNIANSVTANTTVTSVTNGLTQFYMVSLSYFPRQFGGKSRKRRAPGEDAIKQDGYRNKAG